ncbi:hypothetical protein ACFYTQ_15635 [Nocardia sp. NPDC004068]|uniref:hypothetical protein n=1 Tax=Nocardia sp. NPDC004068 TaxID=3364303 RepID=UPI00368BC0C4
MILALILLAALIMAAGAIAVLVVIARHQHRRMELDNELIPGVPTRAPADWSRSHDPAPRLHRRLRDAMRTLHSAPAYPTAASVDLRTSLEQSALALDDHLSALANLPPTHSASHLAEATRAVEAIEQAVTDYATATTKPDLTALRASLPTPLPETPNPQNPT